MTCPIMLRSLSTSNIYNLLCTWCRSFLPHVTLTYFLVFAEMPCLWPDKTWWSKRTIYSMWWKNWKNCPTVYDWNALNVTVFKKSPTPIYFLQSASTPPPKKNKIKKKPTNKQKTTTNFLDPTFCKSLNWFHPGDKVGGFHKNDVGHSWLYTSQSNSHMKYMLYMHNYEWTTWEWCWIW